MILKLPFSPIVSPFNYVFPIAFFLNLSIVCKMVENCCVNLCMQNYEKTMQKYILDVKRFNCNDSKKKVRRLQFTTNNVAHLTLYYIYFVDKNNTLFFSLLQHVKLSFCCQMYFP